MAIEFHFQYDCEDKAQFEVHETAGFFGSLFDCESTLLRAWGLWTSFVSEYRGDHRTLLESVEEHESWDEETDPTPSELLEFEEGWGPSAPFQPEEVLHWAGKWIRVLEALTESQARVLFPLDPDLQCNSAPFGRGFMIKELQHVLSQAECAKKHGVMLTVMVFWG